MADLVAGLGIASARIYAAFGSKEALFREAIALYEAEEGGFADRALTRAKGIRSALEDMLRAAIALYTIKQRGCMVVSAATNCAPENAALGAWLSEHRQARTQSIIERLREAKRCGEIADRVDEVALDDCCATVLHGLSVQARDGVGADRLNAMVDAFLAAFDLMTARSSHIEDRASGGDLPRT